MIKLMGFLSEKFKKLPMKKKTIYSYSIPVIAICVTVNLICFPIFSNSYEKQLRYSVKQSSTQAGAFISNYVENMHYISELITNNGDVNKILSSEEFENAERPDEQYRVFWELNKSFRAMEQSSATYRIGIYIPDNRTYSNNNYYFYPISSLQSRSDYEELMESVMEGKNYFALVNEKVSYNPNLEETYVALFQAINITNEQGENKVYICKVELLVSALRKVIQNANNISNGLVYLIDANGEILVSSNDNYLQELQSVGDLPITKTTPWTELKLGGQKYYVGWNTISDSKWQMFSLIPINEFNKQSEFIFLMVLVMVAVLSIAVVIISYLLSNYYVGRLTKLNQKMKSLEKGNINEGFSTKPVQSGDEFDEIFVNFNFMTEEVMRLLREHYILGKNVMSAELKALQAQINPHFLYNTLDLINWSAMDYGAKEIVEITHNLGQFYRLSLNHGRSAILIKDELKHVEAYVKIENVHFDGAIRLVIDVPEEIRSYACLNIILQPFVENAIIHGIAGVPDITECNITISASREDQDIIFLIKDDANGMDEKQVAQILDDSLQNADNGYGVKNINFRIKLCYGEKYGVSFESTPGVGTTVKIRIPLMDFEELQNSLQ